MGTEFVYNKNINIKILKITLLFFTLLLLPGCVSKSETETINIVSDFNNAINYYFEENNINNKIKKIKINNLMHISKEEETNVYIDAKYYFAKESLDFKIKIKSSDNNHISSQIIKTLFESGQYAIDKMASEYSDYLHDNITVKIDMKKVEEELNSRLDKPIREDDKTRYDNVISTFNYKNLDYKLTGIKTKVNAKIMLNGDMIVEKEYTLEGTYNGWNEYVNIDPIDYYSASEVIFEKICNGIDSIFQKCFKEVDYAEKGDNMVYTQSKTGYKHQVLIYSPVKNGVRNIFLSMKYKDIVKTVDNKSVIIVDLGAVDELYASYDLKYSFEGKYSNVDFQYYGTEGAITNIDKNNNITIIVNDKQATDSNKIKIEFFDK